MPDLIHDALEFRTRLHEATRLVQALEATSASRTAELRAVRDRLREARQKLDLPGDLTLGWCDELLGEWEVAD